MKKATILFSQLKILRFLYYVIVTQIAIVFVFAGIYFGIKSDDNFNGLPKSSSFIDCLYFSVTTASSVGFGDITPKSQTARVIVIIQEFCVFVNFAQLAINLILSNISR